MAKGDLSWIAGVLCSGMGLTFVACGLWFFHRTCTFLATAATAWGEVIDLETRRAYGRQGKRSYVYSIDHPVVRFPLPDGEMVQFTSQIGSTPPEFQVGQSVKVPSCTTPVSPDSGFLGALGPSDVLRRFGSHLAVFWGHVAAVNFSSCIAVMPIISYPAST
jgi:hypothetical protein